jgi:TolB-like protein
MRGTRSLCAAAVGLALILGVSSCATSARVFVNPQADLAFYKKVAVLPFNDLSPSRDAAPRVTRAFVTEMIMSNRFQLVQPEDFVLTLARMGVGRQADGSFDADKLKAAATQLGVTGFIRGAVTEYQMSHVEGGEVPNLAFDAELVDVATGNIVWKSSIARRGKGRIPIVGGNTRSLGKLTQDACHDMVAAMKGKAI